MSIPFSNSPNDCFVKKLHPAPVCRIFLLVVFIVQNSLANDVPMIALADYGKLTTEQKLELFAYSPKLQMRNKQELAEALVLGMRDSDPNVRSNAVRMAAWSLVESQEIAKNSRNSRNSSILIQRETVKKITSLLIDYLGDQNIDIRSAAIMGVANSGSPNPVLETTLLRAFDRETHSDLKAEIIEQMSLAGYNSPTFQALLVEQARTTKEFKELDALVDACVRMRQRDVMSALLQRFIKEEPGIEVEQVSPLFETFGKEASAAADTLVRYAVNNPQARDLIQLQLDSLKREPKPPEPIRPFVDLIEIAAKEGKAAAKPVDAFPTSIAKTGAAEPAFANQSLTPTLQAAVVAVMIVAGCGLIWLLIRSRR